jgi:hypothetical protein
MNTSNETNSNFNELPLSRDNSDIPFFLNDSNGSEELRISFAPTRDELSILARHWLKEVRGLELDRFFSPGYYSGHDSRLRNYANDRLNRIEEFLGKVAMEKLDREVVAKFEAKTDPRLWKMMLEGKEPERDEQGFPVMPPLE